MNLATRYLGLNLAHPIMPGSSPLVDDLDMVRRLEDSGASALVMHSLFEEQMGDPGPGDHEDPTSPFPRSEDYNLTPEQYLDQLSRIKAAVDIPIIGSLNGTTPGGWVDYARLIESAGADALELNVYHVATDPTESGDEVERRTLEILREIRNSVRLPIAVKLSPYYSSLSHFAGQIQAMGADGLVLFNRFYQPDIDLDEKEVVPRLELSQSSELRLRLRWLGILHGQLDADLAASGGIHRTPDVIKAIMAGATTVQIVSALLNFGPGHLRTLIEGLEAWLDANEYESLEQLRGSLSLRSCRDPAAFERGNYLRTLQIWKV